MTDVHKIARALSPIQAEIVRRGCFSGDFTMATVNALKRKGLFELVISSPNGQCGFMELTDIGKQVRQHISTPDALKGDAKP